MVHCRGRSSQYCRGNGSKMCKCRSFLCCTCCSESVSVRVEWSSDRCRNRMIGLLRCMRMDWGRGGEWMWLRRVRRSGKQRWRMSGVVGIGLRVSGDEKRMVLGIHERLRLVDEYSACLAEHRHCRSPKHRRCMCCNANTTHWRTLDSRHRTSLAPESQCFGRVFWPTKREEGPDAHARSLEQLEVDSERKQCGQSHTS